MSPGQDPSSPPKKQLLRKLLSAKCRARRPRSRRCLLKHCEKVFRPRRPLARYCGAACCVAARQWRAWKVQQRYRNSPNGKQKRQAQCRRNRERRKARGHARKIASSGPARVIPVGFFSATARAAMNSSSAPRGRPAKGFAPSPAATPWSGF